MRTKTIFSWIKFIKDKNFGLLLLYLMFCYLLINLLFSIGYHYLCGFNQEMTFFDCFYFSHVTSFTLGYGDLYPVTILGKILVILHMISTSILFAVLIAVLTTKIFHPEDTIIFSKNIFYDKTNHKMGFRLLNVHTEPLINPDIRIHYLDHCVGNVIANITTLKVPDQLIGFLGRHDYTCVIDVDHDFITNLENATAFNNNELNKIKSRFRVDIAIAGKNGIQEVVQIKRYYTKDFKEGKRFQAIQYNESDRKTRVNYLKFGNFKEDFEHVID